jgi:integrase
MNVIITFYRRASSFFNIGERSEFFDEKVKVISFFDKTGFSRTMDVKTTDLAIPNRIRSGVMLENGLTPIMEKDIQILLDYLSKGVNTELYLMVKVALQTGCRQETVATLTIDGLEQCYPDYHASNLMRVKVGPGTGIETKYDVSGDVGFPVKLVDELKEFYYSNRSTFRRLRASNELHQKIFLTKQGNIYSTNTFAMLIHRLRESLLELGHSQFGEFKFHQLRATFGTIIMKAMLKRRTELNAIEYVKEAMLHKDESTTWKYIKFIKREKIAGQYDEVMWSIITGDKGEPDKIIDQLVRGESNNG